MSDLLEQTTPGWRRDPSGRYEWRWWDGNAWTNRVANTAHADAELTGDGPAAPTTVPPRASAPMMPPPAPVAAPAAPPAPAVAHPVAPIASPPTTSPAMTSPADQTPGPDLADPFAALRAPRHSDPMPASPAPVPGGPPSTSPSTVRTFPTSHDGTSGTHWDGPYVPDAAPEQPGLPSPRRRGIVGAVTAFVRSFWEQEESYHSPNAGVALPPHPKASALVPPPNYGRAGLVMLAATGVAVGAYLPWITYRIDDIAHHRTGAELGAAWGFVLAAAAFSIAALLGARHRVMGWVTMGMSVVVAAMVAIRLLDVHDQVIMLNAGPTVSADVGIGLWIMLAAAAIGLVAAFRLDTPAEIV